MTHCGQQDDGSRHGSTKDRHDAGESAVRALVLEDDGSIPNSPLPVLVYPGVLTQAQPEAVIARFARHGWRGAWINGIYPFHHYHSTAHEVLGCVAGWARVQLGGPHGVSETLRAGDVVVIPAGVGHKRLDASDDFAVVGAYPSGQRWDLCYGRPEERPQADANLARVPLPTEDPVFGPEGPLRRHWHVTR